MDNRTFIMYRCHAVRSDITPDVTRTVADMRAKTTRRFTVEDCKPMERRTVASDSPLKRLTDVGLLTSFGIGMRKINFLTVNPNNLEAR